ncbi:hypothetical protein NZK35_15115 [Stieleria sp. ICT_E10.1]|uniref:hypothetical protein n=1 Tax=Stieleria sedimenti TaxID=2976331 RepID=UPI00217FF3D2|nr:hypothetical protein [Stieleria sedimenti]MCS7467983.1 hypothetical protein [Stieleria sedimenti]
MTARPADFVPVLRHSGLPKDAWDASNRAALCPVALLAICCLIGSTAGCRGRAHEDVYRAKMANEIRVLEDQLYDADYQNRVLRDELERSRNEDLDPEGRSDRVPQERILNQSPPHASDDQRPTTPDDYEILDLNSPSMAEPAPPSTPDQTEPSASESPTPEPTPEPAAGSGLPLPPAIEKVPDRDAPKTPDSPLPLVDPPKEGPPKEGLGMPTETPPTPKPTESEGPILELPPPAELIPPGEGELMDEQIIPGPPLPPDDDPESPPGKVKNPDDAKTMGFEPPTTEPLSIPDRLELHDGLSGGHQFDQDADIDGLFLIVTVVDEKGRSLSLANFDVDADLTVVVLEPNDDTDEARIGRWDFTPEQVRDMVRQAPIDGIHIPIAWQDRVPEGNDVMVHIRLAAAEEEMRCQGRVRLEQSVASANWLPRG